MDENTLDEPARCFISYAHADDETFDGPVLQFKKDLEGQYEAQTGRILHAYVDRADLEWGEEWRDGITNAVLNATAFIPIITMKYFNREVCREELMTFYNLTGMRGVRELILPIVIAGAKRISSDDSREVVQIIAKRQYKNFEKAFLAGPGTQVWREAVNEATESLILALESAEKHLAQMDPSSGKISPAAPASPASATVTIGDQSDEDEGELGIFDLQEKLEQVIPEVGAGVVETMAAFQEWSNVAGVEFSKFSDRGDKDPRTLAFAAANALKIPSLEFEGTAARLLTDVARCDAMIRLVLDQMSSINLPQPQRTVRQALAALQTQPEEMKKISREMNEAIENLKMISTVSVPLRKSLVPARNGILALRDSMDILSRWSQLAAGS
ncbi:toll/interleukin-1 receptor domain-containing protein [Embleya sp. NPDC050154]|uniref:toll/interleukin-1 receptor domain-containing protein n=1 Tax=Embleya sp. NPDC050154 TaxID=3363988 RepID=UPI00379370F6